MLKRSTPVLLIVVLAAFLCGSSSALAAGDPIWSIVGGTSPTYFPPNSTNDDPEASTANTIDLTARNLGNLAIDGSKNPITVNLNIQDPGVIPAHITGAISNRPQDGFPKAAGEGNKSSLSCVQPAGPCTYDEVLPPGWVVEVAMTVATGSPGAGSSTAS